MDISKGYLRLFRQMLEWEWYDNPNVKAIFIHCLLCANNTAKKWRDLELKKGQFVTSYEKLAASNGLTIQQTRTALKQLQITHEISYQTTNQYTVITVKNYNLYQAYNTRNSEADTIPNNKRKGGQVTTTNNKDDYSNTCYINSSSSSIENDKFFKITEEEEEILKKYSEEKNKIKYFRPWLRKISKNGDLKEVLEKAKKWNEKQKKKEEAKNEVTDTQTESDEEIKKAMKAAREKVNAAIRRNKQ